MFLTFLTKSFCFLFFRKEGRGKKYCADNNLVTRYYLVVFF